MGVNALSIIAVINFLIGLVLVYQSAIPLQKYGGAIFVADLVVISICKELGSLMTAIMVNGRTSSAFAAELGTMKVNEEIDALTTMGLDPVRFLVVPRVIAAIFMVLILTVFGNLVEGCRSERLSRRQWLLTPGSFFLMSLQRDSTQLPRLNLTS
jgi:phospholipid/cholesterol/gamma-HCH transport system permease protein